MTIKRIIANIVLIFSFGAVMALLVLPFAANAQFINARKFEISYRWKRAAEKYKSAIKLIPFNTTYITGYADFLARQMIQTGFRMFTIRITRMCLTILKEGPMIYLLWISVMAMDGNYYVLFYPSPHQIRRFPV